MSLSNDPSSNKHDSWPRLQRRISELLDSGRTTVIESLLTESPELSNDEQLLLDCIYHEFCERERLGKRPKVDEYYHRFPAFTIPLKSLFEVHVALNHPELARNVQEEDGATFVKTTEQSTVIPAQGMDPTASFVPHSPEKVSRSHRIGDYEILSEIARGGMGVVYKARHAKLGRLAAVKLIKSGELADAEQIQRFHEEAKVAARLDHPGIVPVFEAGEHQGQHFMALAFVDGVPLSKQIKDAPLEPKEAARIMRLVSEAMQYAHERNVLHRDLKPQNVMLTQAGEPKVTDFGLGKHQEEDSGLTIEGQAMGTPSYMPPEQARGDWKHVGSWSDVYSLGATLYCLVTGRPPFQAANARATIEQVIQSEPISPRDVNPAVDKDLETICLKCLQKEPTRRYSSAGALADDLGRFLRDEPILARPVSQLERFRRWCRRNPVVAALVAGMVIALSWTSLVLARMVVAERARMEAQEKQHLAEIRENDAKLDAAQAATAKLQAEADAQTARTAKAAADQLAQTAAAVSSFFRGLILDLDPLRLGQGLAGEAPVTAKVSVDEIIQRGAQRVTKFAEDNPLMQAALMDTIGHVLRSRSDLERAEPLLQRALEIRREKLPANHLDLAQSELNYGWLLHDQGKFTEALEHYQRAFDIQRQHQPVVDQAQHHELLLATTEAQMAWVIAEMGDRGRAEPLFRKVYETRLRILGPNDRETKLAQTYLVVVLIAQEINQDELLKLLPQDDSDLLAKAFAKYLSARAQRQMKQFEASATSYAELIRLANDHFGGIDHPVVAMLYGDLAGMYQEQGDLVHAKQAMDAAVTIGERSLGRHPKMPPVLLKYAEELERLGLYDDSERWFRRAIAIAEVHNATNPGLRFQLSAGLARTLRKAGRVDEAADLLQTAIQQHRPHMQHEEPVYRLRELASFLEDAGRWTEAESQRREVQQLVDPDQIGLFAEITRIDLIRNLIHQERTAEANELTVAALIRIRNNFATRAAPGGPLNDLLDLADFVEEFGDPGELNRWARQALPAGYEIYVRTNDRVFFAVSPGETWSFIDPQGQRATAAPAEDGTITIPEWNLTGHIDDGVVSWDTSRWLPLGEYLKATAHRDREPPEGTAIKNAKSLDRAGEHAVALQIFETVKAGREELHWSPPFLAELDVLAAGPLAGLKQFDAARERVQSAIDVYRKFYGEGHPIIAELLLELAKIYAAAGQPDEAARVAMEAVENRNTHFGDDHPSTKQILRDAAQLLEASQKK